jgi:heme exporter protein D
MVGARYCSNGRQIVNWTSVSAFFEMGGYGLYVWGAYAVTAALMLAEPWLAHQRMRQAMHSAATAPLQDNE